MNNQRQIWNNALNGNSKGAFSLLSSISCVLACTSAWVLLLEGSDGDVEPGGGIAHAHEEVGYYPTCLYWLDTTEATKSNVKEYILRVK